MIICDECDLSCVPVVWLVVGGDLSWDHGVHDYGVVFCVSHVLDMGVLFHSWDGHGGFGYSACGLTWFHDDWITAP